MVGFCQGEEGDDGQRRTKGARSCEGKKDESDKTGTDPL